MSTLRTDVYTGFKVALVELPADEGAESHEEKPEPRPPVDQTLLLRATGVV